MARAVSLLKGVLLTMALTGPAWAEDPEKVHGALRPHPPWFITNVSYGAGAMELYDDTEAMLPMSLTLQSGVRFRAWRMGLSGRWLHNGDAHNFLEPGLFFGGDILSIEQDRHRSLALYGRLEGSFRFSLDRAESPTVATGLYFGLRVFGIHLEAGLGPVFGPFDLPNYPKNLLGMTGEGRVGVELLEFVGCLTERDKCFRLAN